MPASDFGSCDVNVEALGGQVSAANRIGGGFAVVIVLPRNGHR